MHTKQYENIKRINLHGRKNKGGSEHYNSPVYRVEREELRQRREFKKPNGIFTYLLLSQLGLYATYITYPD